jgi:hypothetical protein
MPELCQIAGFSLAPWAMPELCQIAGFSLAPWAMPELCRMADFPLPAQALFVLLQPLAAALQRGSEQPWKAVSLCVRPFLPGQE